MMRSHDKSWVVTSTGPYKYVKSLHLAETIFCEINIHLSGRERYGVFEFLALVRGNVQIDRDFFAK